MMMMSTRCFRGDRPSLTGLRLRRIVSFLRRHRLYDTAHALEKQTGAFFDAAHFRRLLRNHLWADAASYVLGFIAVGDCSREADMLVVRILILRVMDNLAGGRTHGIDALFRRLNASLQSHPDGHHLRRILLSMLSDRARACRLYGRFRPMAVEVILNMAAKCPELKAKAQLPPRTSDPAYILSLGPRLRGCNGSRTNKAGHLPAHVLARSFMQKRPLVSHEIKNSGVPSAPASEAVPPTSPRSAKILSISPATNTGKEHARPYDAQFPKSFEPASDSRKCTKRLQTTGEFAEEAESDTLVHCSLETRRPFMLLSQWHETPLGLLWKSVFPEGSPRFPWAENPRANLPRDNSWRTLEDHPRRARSPFPLLFRAEVIHCSGGQEGFPDSSRGNRRLGISLPSSPWHPVAAAPASRLAFCAAPPPSHRFDLRQLCRLRRCDFPGRRTPAPLRSTTVFTGFVVLSVEAMLELRRKTQLQSFYAECLVEAMRDLREEKCGHFW